MGFWFLIVLVIFELLHSGGSFQLQVSSSRSSIRMLSDGEATGDFNAVWNTKYVTRSIILENALAREKNETFQLHRKVATLHEENDGLKLQLESAIVQNVLLESDLMIRRQQESKFKVRSILLEEGIRKLRSENQKMQHKLERLSSSPSSTALPTFATNASAFSIAPNEEIVITSSSSVSNSRRYEHESDSTPRDVEHATVLDPVVMGSLENYSTHMNVQLKRALVVLSSSIKELLALFLLKCAQVVDAVNRVIENKRGNLSLYYRRLLKFVTQFFNGFFPFREPSHKSPSAPLSSPSPLQQSQLPAYSNHYQTWINDHHDVKFSGRL